ncbi:MAG: alpha/beta fold hydrolase [Chloroflexi bacterium]|nr:alpha/beta fold hydrolase [Chloroflexota bacterium]MBU1661557.1 alpha/beta fold hydrolase [Chloroflexota bacterium]
MHKPSLIYNPHLPGGPFFWEGGASGVLLIHGFTATTAEVRPLAKSLHARGYTVAGPVLPGHNTTPKDINRYSWEDWVATAEESYRELADRCERVFVGGESTGGVLALYLGSNHPTISGILTYAPALKLNISPWDVVIIRLLAPFIPYIPKKKPSDDNSDMAWKGYTVNPLKGTLQLLRLQHETLPLLPAIRQPILIIQGRLDATVRPDVPDTIYNGVNSAVKEIHWMEKSSHCVALDCEFDQVADITLRFLERASL